ncbi:putative signal peptide-containing protein [Cryptosporidium canis]|uniref:Signal peptide-containing protein n=1 Tax=Cryptosporidium canis TaxID=195482 RepID=A0ABQ8P4P5_9CRYT|nr:putative signal peptide-containing protein [Cryptosporidium canis]KAJ1608192.1 putative signal peptide-containing protein [Cryptosporidium canis]
MKFVSICSVAFAALFSVFAPVLSMEHTSLRQARSGATVTKVGLFVEGFSEESSFRTKMTIKAGLGEAEIIELKLEDLQAMTVTDIQLFVAPSEVSAGSESIVAEGMGIIADFVKKGSFLFSQLDSTSPLCKEFNYDGTETTNTNFIFDGVCKGPITKIGPMETECRAAMALVDSRTRMITYNNLYVNGGFYFEDAEAMESCRVLASITPRDNSETLIEFRKNTNAKAIVVACKHGNGAAILSGVQLDQNVSFLEAHVKRHPEHAHVSAVKDLLSEISEFSATLLHFMSVVKVMASQS